MECVVVYATETGTSKEVAEDIAERSLSPCFDVSDYDVRNLPAEKRVLVLVVSTTGQGEMPSSMSAFFWPFLLQKRLARDSLSHLRFVVCGLGDRAYVQFNFAAKKIDARLAQLGAERVGPALLLEPQTLGRGVRALCKLIGATRELPPLPPVCVDDIVLSSDENGEQQWTRSEMVRIVSREALSDGVTYVTLDIGSKAGDVLEVSPPADIEVLPEKRMPGRVVREVSVCFVALFCCSF
jgi:flavodoxin